MSRHIVSFSTGVPSAVTAYLVTQQHPDAIVVFADTLWEDDDNYRFYKDVETLLGKPIVSLTGGQNPLEIANKEGYSYIPNSRTATCTLKAKIKVLREFMQEGDTLYLGMDLSDKKKGRLASPIKNWGKVGVNIRYPIIEQNIQDVQAFAKSLGLNPPRMYSMGYKHANCGGRCVKQGRGDWIRTLENFPERYLEVETWEWEKITLQAVRVFFQMYIAMLHPMNIAWVKIPSMYSLVKRQINKQKVIAPLRYLRLEYLAGEIKSNRLLDMMDELDGYGCTVECGSGNELELSLAFDDITN
jgi:3'-phosphoadenosine 5'-phosphosulfate sulfotransferase (PAPS reductase)/FAD synthetase